MKIYLNETLGVMGGSELWNDTVPQILKDKIKETFDIANALSCNHRNNPKYDEVKFSLKLRLCDALNFLFGRGVSIINDSTLLPFTSMDDITDCVLNKTA